jgi:hypothetical protein
VSAVVPPAHRTDCEPELPFPPTGALYYLVNRRRPYVNFIRAEITRLGYFLYEVQNEPDDGLGCPGWWLVEAAWQYFLRAGVTVRGIRGSWTFGTNLDEVNQLTATSTMSLEAAARKTWAYRQADGRGFSNVRVLDVDGTPGNYRSIDVVFLP